MVWESLAISLGLLLGEPSAAAAPASVSDLVWISGQWVSETETGWTEELWTLPRGGLLLGTSRSGKSDKAESFEFMRIAADAEGQVSFWAASGGRAPVQFRLARTGAGEAAFENPAHDYPQRIVYRREGDRLIASISDMEGKKVFSWTFYRR